MKKRVRTTVVPRCWRIRHQPTKGVSLYKSRASAAARYVCTWAGRDVVSVAQRSRSQLSTRHACSVMKHRNTGPEIVHQGQELLLSYSRQCLRNLAVFLVQRENRVALGKLRPFSASASLFPLPRDMEASYQKKNQRT